MKNRILYPLAFALAILTTACHKTNNVSTDCRIVYFQDSIAQLPSGTYSPPGVVYITYDTTGRIISEVSPVGNIDTYLITFTYIGNMIIKNTLETGHGIATIDTITLNNDGYIKSIYSYENNQLSSYAENYYDNSGKVYESVYADKTTNRNDTATFVWQNGNMIETRYKGQTTQYVFSDKAEQIGDPEYIVSLITYGAISTPNKNLFLGITGDQPYQYTYDNTGRISTVVIPNYSGPGTEQIYTYKYQCN